MGKNRKMTIFSLRGRAKRDLQKCVKREKSLILAHEAEGSETETSKQTKMGKNRKMTIFSLRGRAKRDLQKCVKREKLLISAYGPE